MYKIARPLKEINKRQFEYMCQLQSTQKEICLMFDVTDKTLTRWCKDTYNKSFSEIFAIKKELGKISLRKYQWNLSKKSTAMAIYLGKNYLGQSDKRGIEETDLDIQIKEKQIQKLEAETQLLRTKIETLSNGGSVQEIINGLLEMQKLLENPVENRNITDLLLNDENVSI